MEAEKKNGDKDGKSLYKLISKAVYRNLRNKIHVGIVRNKKRLFRMDIKTKLYMSQKYLTMI